MTLIRHAIKATPLAGLGLAVAAALSGCGGATTGGGVGVATPDSGPVIYGLNAQAINNSGIFGETSGLGYNGSSGQIGVLTGATAYKTDVGPGPLPAYQSIFAAGIPIGFSPTGIFIGNNVTPIGQALPTTAAGAVVFRAYISTGAKGGNQVDLNTGSVILTSSEAPSFSQPLTFDGAGIGNGPLGEGQYTTGTFALPAALTTTGLHNLHTTVADVAGQKSETDFDFVEVAPSDSALLTPFNGATVPTDQPAKTTASVNSISATITNPITGARTRVALDDTSTLILFAAPGKQTLTVTANVTLTHPDKTTQTVTQTGTETETLVAGQAFIGAGVTVSGETPATATPAVRPAFHKK